MSDPSLEHLAARLRVLGRAVSAALEQVDAVRDDGALAQAVARAEITPTGPEVLAAAWEADASAAAARDDGADVRLLRLATQLGLDDVDLHLLVAAAAPALDRRFGPLYAHLSGDVRLAVRADLLLLLAGLDPATSAARARLSDGSVLVDEGLVVVGPGPDLLQRTVHVPDRVVGHLLGEDAVDPLLGPFLQVVDALPGTWADDLGDALEQGPRFVWLRDAVAGLGAAHAVAALAAAGLAAVVLDLAFATADDDIGALLTGALLEAQLRRSGLVLVSAEVVVERAPTSLRLLAECGWPVLAVSREAWDGRLLMTGPVLRDVPPASGEDRVLLWHAALPGLGDGVAEGVGHLRLAPGPLRSAAAAAERDRGAADCLTTADLERAVHAQDGGALQRLARLAHPVARWDALVLDPVAERRLREVVHRVRARDQIGHWGVGGATSARRGVVTLFAGPPGTGKTLAAEVIASDLGLLVCAVDLATVIDKYVGETEKNLDRIFTAAAGTNALLLFDEADALFGKRSEVKDAKDRFANVEVAYLLQRLEAFDGVAVLTTNLRSNLDEAFARRLDVVVDFPRPEAPARRRLWDTSLGARLPRSADVDLDLLAGFELAGGDIRNCALTAAYAAAATGAEVGMADLVGAVHQEYRKLGRLVVPSEFGAWSDRLQ